MQQKVDLSPEPDSFGSPMKEDENMNAEWTQANLDHTRHNSGGWPRGSDTEVDDMCGWCTSQWKDGIDLTKDGWPAAIFHTYIKNASEMTFIGNDQVTPDWKSTAESGQGVELDQKKLGGMLDGLASSLTSRDAWCTAEKGALLTIYNDWHVFKDAILRFHFNPRQPDHESKFLLAYWKKSHNRMLIGCAHCMRGYNIDLPDPADAQKVISNKSKKEWAGFKTVTYCIRDQKATGNERGRGGAQASTEKARTPKATWPAKHQQQDNKSWHSSTGVSF